MAAKAFDRQFTGPTAKGEDALQCRVDYLMSAINHISDKRGDTVDPLDVMDPEQQIESRLRWNILG